MKNWRDGIRHFAIGVLIFGASSGTLAQQPLEDFEIRMPESRSGVIQMQESRREKQLPYGIAVPLEISQPSDLDGLNWTVQNQDSSRDILTALKTFLEDDSKTNGDVRCYRNEIFPVGTKRSLDLQYSAAECSKENRQIRFLLRYNDQHLEIHQHHLFSDLPIQARDMVALYTSLDDSDLAETFPVKGYYVPRTHFMGMRSEGRIPYFVGKNGQIICLEGHTHKSEFRKFTDRNQLAEFIATLAITNAQRLFKFKDIRITDINSDRATLQALQPIPDSNIVEIYDYEFNFRNGSTSSKLRSVPSKSGGG